MEMRVALRAKSGTLALSKSIVQVTKHGTYQKRAPEMQIIFSDGRFYRSAVGEGVHTAEPDPLAYQR